MTTAREWRKHGGRRLGPLPARLDRSEGGRHLWRSLSEQAERPEFRRRLEAEFPAVAPLLTEASRRDVLRIMSASLMLAGLAGCGDPAPDERAVPYVEAPESLVAGVPLFYATAFPLAGYAVPVLVETHMARPIKVEGNPEHPLTRGGTDPLVQAAVLDVYDPDRSKVVTYLDRPATWHAFQAAMVELRERLVPAQGEGLALLTGSTTSPTFYRQLRSLCERFPGLRWYVHEPAGAADQRRHATRLAFGRALGVQHRFDRAELVLSLDDDFLGLGPAQIPNARRWIEARREGLPLGKVPSLYVVEPTPSLTGVKAASVVRATGAEWRWRTGWA